MAKAHNVENYKIVRFSRDIPFNDGAGGKILVKGIEQGVLLSTRALAEIELNFGNRIVHSVEPLMNHYRSYDGQSLDDKSLLIIREGGIGDLLFTTPAISYLFHKYNCKISVACSSQYRQVFETNPFIDTIYPMPLVFDEYDKYNYHISFQGLIEENSEDAKILNAYDLYIKQFGLTDKITDHFKRPTLFYSQQFKVHVELNDKKIFGEDYQDKIRICVHYSTSSKVRNYPVARWFEMIEEILKIDERINVYIMDSNRRANEIESFMKNAGYPEGRVYNLATYSQNLHTAFAMADYMHLMIGADSSMLHVAAAQGKPLIGIYGPFASQLRLKYYKNAIGLDADTKCSPCFLHTGDVTCPYGDPSPCLLLLDYETVVNSIKRLLGDKLGVRLDKPKLALVDDGNS